MSRRLSGPALVLFAAVIVLGACTPVEEQMAVSLLNADRAEASQPALGPNAALTAKAESWAQHLAAGSGGECSLTTLYHSNLTDGAPAGWRRLGENVACRSGSSTLAASVPLIQAQFMASPGHRANIVSSNYNVVGIGLAEAPVPGQPGRTVVFETQSFALL